MVLTANHSTDLGHYPLSPATRNFLDQEELGHWIENTAVRSSSGETMPVIEPATGKKIATVASGNCDDVDLAVQAAQEAYQDGRWHGMDPKEREACLRRLAQLLEQHRDTLSDFDVLEGGAVRGYSQFMVQFGIDVTNYYAGWPTKIHGLLPATAPNLVVQEVREPIGVCAVITPWNGPSAIPLSILPALACGNSVVLKPAEQTPLAALFVARLCREAGLPSGVLNVVQGPGSTAGASMVSHRDVDAISFTGSVDTGRRIQVAAAEGLKRVSLELGGKSAHIFFDDADLDTAIPVAASAIFAHSGQVCIAGSRVLVSRRIHDEFVERLAGCASELQLGSGFDPNTSMGPLVSAQQLQRVSEYVSIGRSEGANIVCGGNALNRAGFFHEPTVFATVRPDMRIAREEIFGPVVVVIPFDDEEEAYAIANATDYGLAAGVWTRDLARAHRASQKLRAGTVWVNTYMQVDPKVSYGGVKHSGFGRCLGHASIDELTQLKSVWFNIG